MKVLLIDVNCKNSSTGKIVYDLYTHLNADGDEAAVCYGRGKVVKGKNIFKFGLEWETYLHAFLTRITGYTGCFSFFSTRRLLSFMKEFKPDVVHLHELHAYFVNIKPLLSYLKKYNIKTICTLHCEFMYTGKCGHSVECEKWQTECGNCPHLRDYPSSIIFDHTTFMFRQKKNLLRGLQQLIITAPSAWLVDRVKHSFLAEKDIFVIHNGIDTECLFYPRKNPHLKLKHGLTNERVVLAVAPNLMSLQKGGRYVLSLAETMQNELIKFIFIGVDDLTEKFPPNVIAIGRTENQQELAEYYSMADCFVICSERENFPTTCLEALCCCTQVVGFNTGGTAETAPFPLGEFCDYGDVESLSAILRKMLSTTTDSINFDSIRKHYSIHRMYEEYREIYKGTKTQLGVPNTAN